MLAPFLVRLLGKDLKHWVRTIVESVLTAVAVAFAWYLQMIISAFYSAIRGGKLFATGLIAILNERGWIAYVPLVAKPFDPNESYADEVVGYTLGAAGFCFQLFNGFALPFPWNLLCLPLTVIEWVLRFQVRGPPGAVPSRRRVSEAAVRGE